MTTVNTEEYDASEQDILIEVFVRLLRSATKDGGRKRAAGIKPPWWRDPDHEKAIFSHLNKRMHGELKDADSGAHPYVHLAWRALAIAYQDTYGKRDPVEVLEFAKTTVGGQPAFPGFGAAYDMGLTEIEIPIKVKVDEDGVAEWPTASETNEIIREHFEPGTCQRCNGEHYQDEKHTRPFKDDALYRPFKDDALYRSGYGRPSSVLAEHIRQQREQEGAV
jgi:hypothetical protein